MDPQFSKQAIFSHLLMGHKFRLLSSIFLKTTHITPPTSGIKDFHLGGSKNKNVVPRIRTWNLKVNFETP